MKIRIKMRQMPGDIPKQDKIELLESSYPDKGTKAFRKMLLMRERAVFKEQTRLEIEREE